MIEKCVGIGLDNVRKALESYKGDLNIKTNDGIFSVTVIIPIMKYDKQNEKVTEFMIHWIKSCDI